MIVFLKRRARNFSGNRFQPTHLSFYRLRGSNCIAFKSKSTGGWEGSCRRHITGSRVIRVSTMSNGAKLPALQSLSSQTDLKLGSRISPMNRNSGTTRIFMVLHGDVYDKFALNGKMKISQRFRDRVSELIENEDQTNELCRFFQRHSDFFSDEVRDNRSVNFTLQSSFMDSCTRSRFRFR